MIPAGSNFVHILNGDALASRDLFLALDNLIICRDAFIEGPRTADSLSELYRARDAYFRRQYGDTEIHYLEDVITEYDKIEYASNDLNYVMWFEEDLFCQCNMLFMAYLLSRSGHAVNLSLVLPPGNYKYAFSMYSDQELVKAFESKINIDILDALADIWVSVSGGHTEKFLRQADRLPDKYLFLKNALQLLPNLEAGNEHSSKLYDQISSIIKSCETPGFAAVFKTFCKQHPEYGLGDLQVKKIYDQIVQLP